MNIRYFTVNLLNVFVAIVEGILGLRFALRLFGANSANDFVNWIYEMSNVLLAPFRGIFPNEVFENRYVLEFSTLFAMLMYAILALLLVALINAVTTPVVEETPVETTTKKRTTVKRRR